MDCSDIQSVTSDHFNHHVLVALKKSALCHDDMGNDVNNDEHVYLQTDRQKSRKVKKLQSISNTVYLNERDAVNRFKFTHLHVLLSFCDKKREKSEIYCNDCMPMCVVLESGSVTSGSGSSSKRPRIDQLPTANLDADDPLDDDVSLDTILYSVEYYQNCKLGKAVVRLAGM